MGSTQDTLTSLSTVIYVSNTEISSGLILSSYLHFANALYMTLVWRYTDFVCRLLTELVQILLACLKFNHTKYLRGLKFTERNC